MGINTTHRVLTVIWAPPLYCTLTLIAMQGHRKLRQKVWVQLNFVTLGLGSDGYQHYTQSANCHLGPTVILYAYINRHAGTPKAKTKSLGTAQFCYVGSRVGWVSTLHTEC